MVFDDAVFSGQLKDKLLCFLIFVMNWTKMNCRKDCDKPKFNTN